MRSENLLPTAQAQAMRVVWLLLLVGSCLSAVAEESPLSSPPLPGGHRLAHSASAYLRQHAQQPVEWYPWGEVAFARAKAENKPVLVSVGYSTCHWCHVMARESFSDSAVAAALAADFIAIKVDRDERPDLDRRFLAFVEATHGEAGWPLQVWLTPEGKPFFGHNYLPKDDEAGTTGFLTLIKRLATLWRTHPEQVLAQEAQLTEQLSAPPAVPIDEPRLDAAFRSSWLTATAQHYDPVAGGFESGPKFPNAVTLQALLAVAFDTPGHGQNEARDMALHTLRQLARSSLHDVVAGGFHRYAVDAAWHVPHFEKLLVDQALLALAYTDAAALTGDAEFRETALSILAFIQRDLLTPAGLPASALDAEGKGSRGETREGGPYLWTESELLNLLTPDELRALRTACPWRDDDRAFGTTSTGEALRVLDPSNDSSWKVTPHSSLAAALSQLNRARRERGQSWRDDLSPASHSALTARAFTQAGRRFGLPDLIATGAELQHRLLVACTNPANGRIQHLPTAFSPDGPALLDDAVQVVASSLALFEATGDPSWLAQALLHQENLETWFALPGGAYRGHPEASAPGRSDTVDRGEPSALAVAVGNLGRLAALTHQPRWSERLQEVFAALRPHLVEAPSDHPTLLAATRWLHPGARTVLACPGPAGHRDPLLRILSLDTNPQTVTLPAFPEHAAALALLHAEWSVLLPDGPQGPAAMLCVPGRCLPPVSTPLALAQLLSLSTSVSTP